MNLNPGWGSLRQELALASSVRAALRYGGFKVGAKALYHAAWQFFSDRWLNITPRSLGEPLSATKSDAPNEDTGLRRVLDSIETIQVRDVGRHTREYLNAGFSADRLLSEMGSAILKDDNGWNLVHMLRTVFDERTLCEGHPARNQLLIALSRWGTDVRKRTRSHSAAQTAMSRDGCSSGPQASEADSQPKAELALVILRTRNLSEKPCRFETDPSAFRRRLETIVPELL